MRTLVLSLLVSVSGAHAALAHGGHVGDLAGHSHWLGWAAVAAAGAIAAWAIKRRAKAKSQADAAGAEARPETAEA
ncbi:MAG: DUF6732 family protein [Hoeflea sp.]|uniref:DUF6732 family protein n=1 Tax=Hoeflea sp. TaxID=1940281 RepID=UPI0027306D86|nr:DUF6732 family protein [Hoeflea sp.]MDP2120480.1 hypothetical protein [Hoeflea sp.]MDZ7602196.1 DUF6732 family protein [Hoeflea sp.]